MPQAAYQRFPPSSDQAMQGVQQNGQAHAGDADPGAGGESALMDFYRGTNILLTGATGFMGKILLEKLLRTCPEVGTIYILIRPKKGQKPQQRAESIFDDPVFSLLKEQQPKFRHHVQPVEGDCALEDLGLSPEDRAMLAANVNVVFHGAATVRFDEKLSVAVAINVNGTKAILTLAKEMTKLKSIMQVSTAYSHCVRKDIDEKFYDMPVGSDKVLKMVGLADDKMLEVLTPVLVDKWPNTYAYTKALGEDVVRTCSGDLPMGIFRPGIVTSTAHEPIPGWIDNLYGPTGVVVGAGIGLLRTLQCDNNVVANMVPVDMAVNALIAAAWECSTLTKEERKEKGVLIYNYVSSVEKPVTWGQFMEMTSRHGLTAPSQKAVWMYSLHLTRSRLLHIVMTAVLHFLPALLVDTVCVAIGKPFRLLKVYKKIYKFSDVISFFSMREWNFHNDRVQALWQQLGERDRELFQFSMRDLEWDPYFSHYIFGCRTYLMKDDPKNVPQSIVRYKKFYWMHQAVKLFFVFLALRVVWWALGGVLGGVLGGAMSAAAVEPVESRSPLVGALRHWGFMSTEV